MVLWKISIFYTWIAKNSLWIKRIFENSKMGFLNKKLSLILIPPFKASGLQILKIENMKRKVHNFNYLQISVQRWYTSKLVKLEQKQAEKRCQSRSPSSCLAIGYAWAPVFSFMLNMTITCTTYIHQPSPLFENEKNP